MWEGQTEKMGLDYSLAAVFDNQSDKADVLLKNVIFFSVK